MKLYAAYGSNLNMHQMAIRCPKAVVVGKSMLRGHQLIFRGVADVIPWRGAETPIGVWRITDECEAALDRYEGVARRKGDWGLYRKETIKFDNGEEALIYFMNSKGISDPSDSYFDTILQGYLDFGLPVSRLRQARERSIMKAYPTASLTRRQMRRAIREIEANATV